MIVIGDVHGCFKTLLALLDQLPKNREICFVGDIIDRGRKSKEVYELIRKNNYKCVLGNHEEMSQRYLDLWLGNGGSETLKSFGGLESFKNSGFGEWVDSLPLYIQYKNFIISHSIAYSVWHCKDKTRTNALFTDELLWGRNFEYNNMMPDDYINVFGHTPVQIPIKNDHYVLIDTGCVFNSKKYNKLTAYDLDEGCIYLQKNIELYGK